MQQVFSNQSGNGDSTVVDVRGGAALVKIKAANFDGATVTLKVSGDGGTTYVDVPDGAYTADTLQVLEIASAEVKAKLTVSSAGGSTDIDAWIG